VENRGDTTFIRGGEARVRRPDRPHAPAVQAPLPIYDLGHRHGWASDVQSDDSCLHTLPQTTLSPRGRSMTITATARHTVRALAVPRCAIGPKRPPRLQASFLPPNVLRS